MTKVMLINASQIEESRIAVVQDGSLELFEIETIGEKQLKGNIYKGRVANLSPSIQAAFVDIGLEKPAFLPLDEVNFKNKPPFQPEIRRKSRRLRISDIFRRGEEVVVQVSREGFGEKPPTLSTFYSLAGRYLVLTPYVETEAISRKIENFEQREKLKKMVAELNAPAGFGIIVRTAGMDQSRGELLKDFRYLSMLWRHIERAARESTVPSLIFKERDIVIRTIRDYFMPDISEVIVDDEQVFHDIQRFFRAVMPEKEKILKRYTGDTPLFMKYNMEEQIEAIFRRRVELRSGGYIVIDSAEALTAIDVNSGRLEKVNSLEETAFQSNLEAAEEIAKQLRLRDIGGPIVIDFIDMKSQQNIRLVEKKLRDALKKDKARFDMTRMSKFGIVEISRQRMKAAKSSARYRTCIACGGGGMVKTVESATLSALSRIQSYLIGKSPESITIQLPEEIALYLLNAKRRELGLIEKHSKVRISIKVNNHLKPGEYQFEAE
ncbi:MAG: Rne/Rng family ribonuclease [Acidobacteriota bacterium]